MRYLVIVPVLLAIGGCDSAVVAANTATGLSVVSFLLTSADAIARLLSLIPA